MTTRYVYRTYKVSGAPESLKKNLYDRFISEGYSAVGENSNTVEFRYPSVTFSSAKPLTCVSRLTATVENNNDTVLVRIGVSFTKIRYYTITIFTLLCFVLPAAMSYVKYGFPQIPPLSYLGLPLGVMIHYHVRWRVFSAIRRLIQQVGG